MFISLQYFMLKIKTEIYFMQDKHKAIYLVLHGHLICHP